MPDVSDKSTLQLRYQNIGSYVSIEADCSAIDFQNTSIADSGADDVGLNPRIYPHRGHARADFAVSGNLADFHPSRVTFLGKRGDFLVASFAGKALLDFIGETATVFLLSIPVHAVLPLHLALR